MGANGKQVAEPRQGRSAGLDDKQQAGFTSSG